MPHVCPWWLGALVLANPLRRVLHDPARIVAPLVREGTTVLEPGPGVGWFTLELARRVGPGGRVVAVDVQPRMLHALRRRAARAGLLDRVDARLAAADGLGVADLAGRVDLTFAFAVVHELPDAARFLAEARAASAPGGRLLVAEPRGHVTEAAFAATLAAARRAGFEAAGAPAIRGCRAALLAAR